MFQRIALSLVVLSFVAALAAPAVAEEPLSLEAILQNAAPAETPAPGAEAPEPPPITLEELEQLFGAQNVCGAECGFGLPHCRFQCGDAASCYRGFCVYI